MAEPCATIVGSRGSGKSEGLKVDILRVALEGLYAILVIDPPGKLVRELVAWLILYGLEKRILYEPLADVRRVLRWPYVERSLKTGLDAVNENEMEDGRLAQTFWANREVPQREQRTKAYTKNFLDLDVAIFRSQPGFTDLRGLYYAFRPRTKQHDELMERAEEGEAIAEFADVEYRGMRNPTQYEM